MALSEAGNEIFTGGIDNDIKVGKVDDRPLAKGANYFSRFGTCANVQLHIL